MTNNADLKIWSYDHTKIFLLFFLLVFSVYKLPSILSVFVILPTLVLFFRSKKDYFWLAFFTLILLEPIGLFGEGSASAIHRLPLFTIISGFSIGTQDIIITTIIIKALVQNSKTHLVFQKSLQGFFLYAILLVFLSIVLWQTQIGVVINNFRQFYYFFLILGYNNLIKNEDEFYKFLLLILPFMALQLFDVIYFFSFGGKYLMELINPLSDIRKINLGLELKSEFNARYLVSGFKLILISFMGSLVFSTFHKNKSYFLFLAVICYIIILFSGTRSWFVITSLILLMYFYRFAKKQFVNYAIIILILIISYFLVGSGIKSGISGAINRINTLTEIGAEGNEANQTINGKIENRLPAQLDLIKSNPLTGWAFTTKLIDNDVGNFALIAEVGFLGFFLFIIFWFKFGGLLTKGFKNKDFPIMYRNSFYILFWIFIGLLISHFTTNRIFGLTIFPIFLSVFIVFTNKLWISANLNKQIK